jgi:CBS domain-containing protein
MNSHAQRPTVAVATTPSGGMTIRSVMRPPTTTIEPDAHLAAAAYLIKHNHDSALLVVTEDSHEPIGLVTDHDITKAVAHGRNLEETRISQIVNGRPVTAEADVSIAEATRLMLAEGLHHLPVVEDGRLIGVVDLADICRVCLATGQFAATRDKP